MATAIATRTREPMGAYGAPYIGETFAFIKDPYTFVKRRRARYGPYFYTGFFGKKTTVMPGAEAQRYVLATNYRNFPWREGYKILEPFLTDSLAATDGPIHDSQRKLVSPAFHGRNMPAYVAHMDHSIDHLLDEWGNMGTRPFYEESRHLSFTLATSLLLGVETGKEYDLLNRLWRDFAAGFVSVVRLNAPFTTYGRAVAAKNQIEAQLRMLVAERRQQESSNALGLLIAARDEEGNALTDEQLIAQIKVLIFAGYDTAAGVLGWLMAELLRHPEMYERARAEVNADAKDAPLSYDDLRQKPFLDAVIKETLRVHPQTAFMLRGAKEAFELEGYSMPAGQPVMLVPAYTHFMPEYFEDPFTFDPERFMAPRDEDARSPYAWIGFGGGPRICLGENLGKIEVKAAFTKLVRRFDFSLVPDQDYTPLYVPLSRPTGEVMVNYRAR